MRIKRLLASLLPALIFAPGLAKSEETPLERKNAASVFWGEGNTISFRHSMSEKNNIVIRGSYSESYIDNIDNAGTIASAETSSVSGEYHNFRETSYFSAGIGIRHYYQKSQYATFFQILPGLYLDRSKTNYYFDSDEDKDVHLRKSYMLGCELRSSLGVEYFVTERVSIDGVLSLAIGGNLVPIGEGGDRKVEYKFVRTSTSLAANYYW